MAEIVSLSAVELRRRTGSNEITPTELVEACIDRIESVNPQVNAVITTNYVEARRTAKQATSDLRSGGALPPLHGLPVVVKDLSDTRGLRTTYGSRCFADHVPESDSILVERLRSAGAIVLGKTNTPEFGAGANTSNQVFGATGNPFNPNVTSGGSSGGSAAALACDMAPLATGSDLGGSLRIPASFCGVVGMRPSPGLVPSKSHVSGFSQLWTDGPMARSVEDLALLLSSISAFDPRDPLSTPASRIDFDDFYKLKDLTGMRVGFSTDLGVAEVDQEIATLFDARKADIGRHFHNAEDVNLELSDATEIFRVLRAESLYAAYGELVSKEPEMIGSNVRGNILEAAQLSLLDTARADAAHTALYRRFQTVFDDIDYLVCPATAVSPFPVEENHPVEINGRPLDGYFAWYAITWALSLTGCPIVTIPCGFDHNNMPFGIQIVGKRFSDLDLLQLSHALETALARDGLGRRSATIRTNAA
ncbi:MAG: amidase family protein [Stappiaceae bacterium]